MENQPTPKKSSKIAIWLPLIIGLSIAIGIFIGNAYTRYNKNSMKTIFSVSNKNSNKVDVLLDYLNRFYVDSISSDKLIEQAIPSIISELDPHSAYIPREDMISKGTELEGYFGGIGVEFIIKEDTVNIVNVTMGGPSEALGILSGDKIILVNDSVFAGTKLTNNTVVKTLRGAKGTKVKLGIQRGINEELLDFEIIRDEVAIKSIDASYMVNDSIGYIKISRFAITTHDEFMEAVKKLKALNATSFIVDLQDNTGGSLGTAIKLTNEFLNAGDLILYTEGRTYPRENFVADGKGRLKTEDIVVLINENSASASEIFAGAIQDLDRGLVIGRRSFGKGLVQSQYQFPDESAIRITIARYHTPSGRCTQKPYEIGDRNEYDLDMVHRYENGEFYNQDSLKLDYLPQFSTKKGRTVYGDIGIMPDIFIGRDTLGWNAYFEKVYFTGALREFAFKYADENKSKLKAMDDWKVAYSYLKTQPLAKEMAVYAFDKKKIKQRPVLLAESKTVIDRYLMALILRDVFSDEEAFFSILQTDDPTIEKAIQMIKKGKASPDAVGEELYLIEKN